MCRADKYEETATTLAPDVEHARFVNVETGDEMDAARDADWYYQPRSASDLAELKAEHEADFANPSRRGRSFANDFRRAPSITVAEWNASKTARTRRRNPTRSKARATRRAARPHATPGAQEFGDRSAAADPPPAHSPAAPSTASSTSTSASASRPPVPDASGAAHEVLAFSDRERRLIDFLVDEALNEWWTQNSRD